MIREKYSNGDRKQSKKSFFHGRGSIRFNRTAPCGQPERSSSQSVPPAMPTERENLRKPASELYGDGLNLRVLLQPVFAQFTSDSRVLEATKWRPGVDDVVAIHPDRSSPYTVSHCKRLFDVTRPDAGRESILCAVCACDHFLQKS